LRDKNTPHTNLANTESQKDQAVHPITLVLPSNL